MIKKEELTLLPERAIFWEKHKLLIVSDLHLGKAGHFRKHGIPVSRKVHLKDLAILNDLIEKWKPEQVMFLGDLFHSFENNEWQDFIHFLQVHEGVKFTLVEGNHDILEEYPATLHVVNRMELGPFSFTHILEEDSFFNISGHIHPGVRITGKARQGITLPCFHFTDSHAIMPAFGQFTGIKKIKPKKGDRIFAVAEDRVIELI
ncbi:MAG: ligase-associated DNA damage response endonuclease PdeM [Ekhidna sp.]